MGRTEDMGRRKMEEAQKNQRRVSDHRDRHRGGTTWNGKEGKTVTNE